MKEARKNKKVWRNKKNELFGDIRAK